MSLIMFKLDLATINYLVVGLIKSTKMMVTTTNDKTKRWTGFSTISTKITKLKCSTNKRSETHKAVVRKSRLLVTRAKKRINLNT